MPNQLSESKRRQSLAEHTAVLAALAQIAKSENTTVMALMRDAVRAIVRTRVQSSVQVEALRTVVWQQAPVMPAKIKTPAQLARFKRAQRAFDQVIIDLQLATPDEVQARNSITLRRPVLLNFDEARASV
ncbi:MAG TPA: hypothetical protein VHD32_16510 [Candidatus Didemnitutus sp.]|nr:hypothetical protein [Candidatus Didemnitutus sp.]